MKPSVITTNYWGGSYVKATVFLLLTVLCGAASASTLYNITFAKDNGAGPDASGSFTYDVTTGFSNFIVVWSGFPFDLTASANAPTLGGGNSHCAGRASTAAYSFFMLQQSTTGCDSGTFYFWQGNEFGTTAQFNFSQSVSGDEIIKVSSNIGNGIGNGGTFSITPVSSTTPEPTSVLLFGGGLIACLLSRWLVSRVPLRHAGDDFVERTSRGNGAHHLE